MSDLPVPPTGTVHWVGTGLSTGRTGLDLLGRVAEVVLWGRTRERAEARLTALAPHTPVRARGLDRDDLATALRPGDVLVSMLPAAHHSALSRTALDAGAHFACTSYTSPEIEELAREAAAKGLVVLTEAGLDPGIDHLMTHLLVARAREAVGDHADRVSLASYCGGIPAEPNEFRYRFSWAPSGVLTALTAPARYVRDGQVREVERPWEDTEELVLDGEVFEGYPNRDSVGFIGQYGFPEGWRTDSFVRGTLRPQGWRAAWKGVFDTVASGDRVRLDALAGELAERYPTTDTDRDRVVLTVGLEVEHEGRHWSGRYRLDVTGDDTDTAMARCVSTTVAVGVERVLAGALPPGPHRATADTEEASRWLDRLARAGLPSTLRSTDQERQH
ncbi:saccharopine dehydrogenase family protein [Streptomyces sp. NPDC005423]|uniref:saccharopine dehydrogenase family protein n=1 Tax=Streptomyces sp. NPDC005423 TaxID=3155343 RepID=UPI0033ABBE53